MNELDIGPLNGHATGIIMKEAVRRAMVAIRSERLAFEVHRKDGYGGGTMDDVSTSADQKAQACYQRMLSECFPGVGIIAEEEFLKVRPAKGINAYFTVDPLDGTKAYVRRQTHGVGTMIALVLDGAVAAAFVGDVNAGEVYGFRPGSDSVWRINSLDVFERIEYCRTFQEGNKYILLRDPLDKYSPESRGMAHCFRSHQIDGGSIGLWLARLWKREVCAAIMPPSHETPWDSTPVIGISRTLGYRFYRPDPNGRAGWTSFDPELPQAVVERPHDMLVIHPHDMQSIFG